MEAQRGEMAQFISQSSSMSSSSAASDAVAQVEELVDKATSEHLNGPEWQLNMALCDIANANHATGDDIVRALQRKLQSESPRTVLQTLILVEALVKNGPKTIHAQIGTRGFLNEVAALTDGSLGFDVQNQSLLLIKQWADAFAGSSLATFQDTYRQLKIQGVDFPEIENDVPIFTPPPSSSISVAALSTAGSSSFRSESFGAPGIDGGVGGGSGKRTREQQIEKLHLDLHVVMEKITLFRDIWTSGGAGEELEDALDFLRQCQPRMNTLIEGGIMGKIDEKTLEKCLTVNDHLIKALEESRSSSNKQSADLISFDSPPRASRKSDIGAGMNRLSLQEGGAASPAAAAGGARTGGSTFTSMDDGKHSA